MEMEINNFNNNNNIDKGSSPPRTNVFMSQPPLVKPISSPSILSEKGSPITYDIPYQHGSYESYFDSHLRPPVLTRQRNYYGENLLLYDANTNRINSNNRNDSDVEALGDESEKVEDIQSFLDYSGNSLSIEDISKDVDYQSNRKHLDEEVDEEEYLSTKLSLLSLSGDDGVGVDEVKEINRELSNTKSNIKEEQEELGEVEDEQEELEDIDTSTSIYNNENETCVVVEAEDPDPLQQTKINMYDNPQYNLCQQKAEVFENSPIGVYYKNNFCLKPCLSSKCRESTVEKYYHEIKDYISNDYKDVLNYNQMRLCVLQKDHDGACSSSPYSMKKMLQPTRVSNKMETSVNSCIYQVPGDTSGNSYYKNRASRLYPIVISSDTKFKINRESSNTKVPKICISLKEHTTPFLMATAYIDWVTYALLIEGMEEHILPTMAEPYIGWKRKLVGDHASFLHDHFQSKNRKIFDMSSGVRKTICAVKQNVLTVDNFADISRDNRINIDQNDIQMGHIVPRNNNEYTIRGTNLLMMTREGNRAVGENDYMDNTWIMRDISILKNLCDPTF